MPVARTFFFLYMFSFLTAKVLHVNLLIHIVLFYTFTCIGKNYCKVRQLQIFLRWNNYRIVTNTQLGINEWVIWTHSRKRNTPNSRRVERAITKSGKLPQTMKKVLRLSWRNRLGLKTFCIALIALSKSVSKFTHIVRHARENLILRLSHQYLWPGSQQFSACGSAEDFVRMAAGPCVARYAAVKRTLSGINVFASNHRCRL